MYSLTFTHVKSTLTKVLKFLLKYRMWILSRNQAHTHIHTHYPGLQCRTSIHPSCLITIFSFYPLSYECARRKYMLTGNACSFFGVKPQSSSSKAGSGFPPALCTAGIPVTLRGTDPLLCGVQRWEVTKAQILCDCPSVECSGIRTLREYFFFRQLFTFCSLLWDTNICTFDFFPRYTCAAYFCVEQ